MAREAQTRETTPLSVEEEAFLRAFTRALIAVPRALEADLQRDQGLTINDYAVLMHLSEAPDRTLRMGDLAARTGLSLSGMTRVVRRLEGHDWVRRERSCSDRRGNNAVLTDEGLERLRAAWPTHVASVRSNVIDHLAGLDLPTITRAIDRFGATASART